MATLQDNRKSRLTTSIGANGNNEDDTIHKLRSADNMPMLTSEELPRRHGLTLQTLTGQSTSQQKKES
ncbi:MAG: hypothetical protein IKP16_08090 [Prevotella sp.]|nr:hypothetical protein [Prevotella sp.]